MRRSKSRRRLYSYYYYYYYVFYIPRPSPGPYAVVCGQWRAGERRTRVVKKRRTTDGWMARRRRTTHNVVVVLVAVEHGTMIFGHPRETGEYNTRVHLYKRNGPIAAKREYNKGARGPHCWKNIFIAYIIRSVYTI